MSPSSTEEGVTTRQACAVVPFIKRIHWIDDRPTDRRLGHATLPSSLTTADDDHCWRFRMAAVSSAMTASYAFRGDCDAATRVAAGSAQVLSVRPSCGNGGGGTQVLGCKARFVASSIRTRTDPRTCFRNDRAVGDPHACPSTRHRWSPNSSMPRMTATNSRPRSNAVARAPTCNASTWTATCFLILSCAWLHARPSPSSLASTYTHPTSSSMLPARPQEVPAIKAPHVAEPPGVGECDKTAPVSTRPFAYGILVVGSPQCPV